MKYSVTSRASWPRVAVFSSAMFIGVLISTSCEDKVPKASVVVGGPTGALSQARKWVTPAYPPISLARASSGLAVVRVSAAADGHVIHAELLESPDAEIGTEAVKAARQTEFNPVFIEGKPQALTGKLFYLYEIVGGTGRVSLPPFKRKSEDIDGTQI